MDLLEIHKDHERRAASYSKMVGSYRAKDLLPGVSRAAFEAALKIGFDTAWELQRKHHSSVAVQTNTERSKTMAAPSSIQLDATLVATIMEYLCNQGRSVTEIKGLFAPEIIDGWFAIRAESEKKIKETKVEAQTSDDSFGG